MEKKEKHKRIIWKRGMEITPATFEDVDSYRDESFREIRRLLTVGRYGLLSNASKNVSVALSDNGRVSVKVIQLMGVTRSGEFLDIEDQNIQISTPDDKGSDCYLVVHTNGIRELEINNVCYATDQYEFEFRTLSEIKDRSIPFAKLKNEHGRWFIQDLYVPPCLSISSDPELIGIVRSTSHAVATIVEKLDGMARDYKVEILRDISLELSLYTMTETPQDFYKLLRRTVRVLESDNLDGREKPEAVVHTPFDNNDILRSIVPLVEYVIRIKEIVSKQIVKEEPIVKKEEPKVDFFYEI